MVDIKEKVADYIEKNRLIEAGSDVVAGVSGGADSVCLLLLLHELSGEMDFSLRAVYVEHGIRGEESIEDGRFVEDLCKKLGVPFEMKSVDVPAFAAENHLSTEEAARQLRYEAIFEDGAQLVAVAHNADDNVETIVYRLARGTGVRGMCGMRPKRRYEDGDIIRPLLCCERSEIEDYLEWKGQSYRTDSTNLADEYARNKIRHQILPVLKEINSGAIRHFNTAATELYTMYRRDEERAEERLSEVWGEDSLSRSALLEMPEEERTSVIRSWLISELGGKDIGRTHIDAAMKLISAETGKEISLPGAIKLCAEYDRLMIKRERRSREHRATDEVRLPLGAMQIGDTCELDVGDTTFSFELTANTGEELPQKGYAKWFDYDKITNDLVVRTRQRGDYITINKNGSRAKLQDYLVNEKLPREQRDSVLMLCAGSEVMMIAGFRRGESALIDEDTKRILKVTIIKEDGSDT